MSIDGGFDAGYQSIDYKGNKVSGIANNGTYTSQINFRGVTDLGGGMKADFRLESDFNTVSNKANTGSATTATTLGQETLANGSTFGNGEVRVGLNGSMGRIDLGVVNFNTLGTFLGGQPFGTAVGGGYGSISRANAAGNAVRDDNSVKITTPTFSGFNATLYKSYKQTKANATAASATAAGVAQTSFSTTFGAYDKLGSDEIGLNYANGPIAASYSTLKQDSVSVGTGTTETTLNTLGANYTMGAAKFFLLNQTNKTTTGTVATDTKYTSVSATYTIGNTVLMVQSGSNKQNAGTNAGKKSTLTGLGADYNLSKTTAVYFRNESIKDEAGLIAATAVDGAGNKRTRTALGLRVTF